MDYKDYADGELLNLIKEESEEAKDILYKKYKYIIDIIIRKYTVKAKMLNIEYNDLYQEALLGFSDAINRYNDNRSSFRTFMTICVDRRLQVVIKKAGSLKNKLMNDSLSLEYSYSDKQSLMEILSDENRNNPLNNLEMDENYFSLIKVIKKKLSSSEKEVFSLLINNYNYQEIAQILNKDNKQVDNAIQRIKSKVKNILENH